MNYTNMYILLSCLLLIFIFWCLERFGNFSIYFNLRLSPLINSKLVWMSLGIISATERAVKNGRLSKVVK